MAEIAKEMDSARVRKAAMHSSGKMSSRISAGEDLPISMPSAAAAPSFLRGKKSQGKPQSERRPDD